MYSELHKQEKEEMDGMTAKGRPRKQFTYQMMEEVLNIKEELKVFAMRRRS